jgi:hypothetical protein
MLGGFTPTHHLPPTLPFLHAANLPYLYALTMSRVQELYHDTSQRFPCFLLPSSSLSLTASDGAPSAYCKRSVIVRASALRAHFHLPSD